MTVVYHKDGQERTLQVEHFDSPRSYRNWKRRKAQRNILIVKVKY